MRYRVDKGSNSAHCCFEFSIIDTTEPQYADAVCECFDELHADLICAALNAQEEARPK